MTVPTRPFRRIARSTRRAVRAAGDVVRARDDADGEGPARTTGRGRSPPARRRPRGSGDRGTGRTPLRGDERAVSTTVNYVLAIGIVAILVSGLLIGTGDFLSDQRQQAVRMELETLGNRIAGELASVDRLSRSGGAVNVTLRRPERVAGSTYTTELVTGGGCPRTCVELTADRTDTTVRIPVGNRTSVSLDRDGERFWLNSSASPRGTSTSEGAGIELNVDSNIGVGRGIDTNPPKGSIIRATNQRPIAGFRFAPGTPGVGRQVNFYNETDDVDGVITNFSWDVTDNGTFERYGPDENATNWTYTAPGRYDVRLRVTDDEGDTGNVTKPVVVSGLVYNRDAEAEDHDSSGDNDEGGVRFSLANRFADDGNFDGTVELLRMFVQSRPPTSTDHLEEGDIVGREVEFDTDGSHPDNRDGFVDYDGDDMDYDATGVIEVDLDSAPGGGSAGSNPVVGPGANVTVLFSEFRDSSGGGIDVQNEKFYVIVKYKVNTTGPVASSELYYYNFSLEPDNDLGGSIVADLEYSPTSPFTGQTVTFDASNSYATGSESIDEYVWDFDGDGTADETTSTPMTTHTYTSSATYDPSVTVEDATATTTDTASATVQVVDASTGAYALRVNFQDSDAETPTGFLIDTGEAFGSSSQRFSFAGESYAYGWFDSGSGAAMAAPQTRDRDSVDSSLGREWDTLNHMDPSEESEVFEWATQLPNGDYRVHLVTGDPDYTDQETDVRIEGVELDGDDLGDGNFHEYNVTVTVDDGSLNVTPMSSLDNGKLVFVEIDPIAFQQESDGTVVLQAENYMDKRSGIGSYSSYEWESQPETSETSGPYMDSVPADSEGAYEADDDEYRGPVMNYTVEFEQTGDYEIWARLNGRSGTEDSVQIAYDGTILADGSTGFDATTGSWEWTKDGDDDVGFTVSSTGPHRISVWMRESGTRIDKLYIVPKGDPGPSDEGPTESTTASLRAPDGTLPKPPVRQSGRNGLGVPRANPAAESKVSVPPGVHTSFEAVEVKP